MHVMPQRMNHTDLRILETGGIALAAAVVLTAIGTYSGDGESNDTSVLSFVVFAVVLAAVTTAIYAVGVRRAETREDARARVRPAIIFGACAAVSVAVFWTGLPVPLAAAALLLGYDARRGGATGAGPLVAMGLGGLATVAAVVLAFTG